MRFIYGIIVLFVCIWLINVLFGKSIKQIKVNYEKADTTIIIKNGNPDTVITKKSLPWYLK